MVKRKEEWHVSHFKLKAGNDYGSEGKHVESQDRLKPRPLVPKSAKLGMKKKNSGRKLRVLPQ